MHVCLRSTCPPVWNFRLSCVRNGLKSGEGGDAEKRNKDMDVMKMVKGEKRWGLGTETQIEHGEKPSKTAF